MGNLRTINELRAAKLAERRASSGDKLSGPNIERLVEVVMSVYRRRMLTVDIRALNDELRHCIRAVANGESVLITDRERVIAEIVPPRSPAQSSTLAQPTTPEEKWAELIRQGLEKPAKIPRWMPPPPRQPAVMTLEELMREIDDDRADR